MDVSDSEIDAAVAAGKLSPLDAHELRTFVAQRRAAPPPIAADRHFRYRGSAGGAAAAVGVLAVGAGLGGVALATVGPVAGLPIALLAALLARRFADRREGAPTSALYVVFALGLAIGVIGLLGIEVHVAPAQGLVIAGSCALASFAFWHRLRLPLAYAAGIVAALTLGDHLLALIVPDAPPWLVTAWMMASAAIVFVIAMWWDASDIYRQTIRSDIAWWLHGIAAFQLCAAGLRAIVGVRGQAAGWNALWSPPAAVTPLVSTLVLLLFAVYAAVAVAIDRRGLAVFGTVLLVPVAVGALGQGFLPIALCLAGAAAIVMALRWTKWRARLLPAFPTIVRAQLPRTGGSLPLSRPLA